MFLLLILSLAICSNGQILQCSNNYSATIDSNPTLYLSLVTEGLNIGLETYEITMEQSKGFTSSFSQKLIKENKMTTGTEFNVGGVIDVFNIGAKSSLEFASMSMSEKFSETKTEKSWASGIKGSYNLKKGQFFFSAAEMKLYVFKDHDGIIRTVSLPTGRIQNGAFAKENLLSWILDKSFEGLMRTTQWQLPTHTLKEIEVLVAAKNNTPTIPKASFPEPSLYYYIENSQYPGSRLHGNGMGCTKHWVGSEDQKWRFQPEGNFFFIYNKHNKNHRLTGNGKGSTYDGGIYEDQKWKLTFEGGNRVRITYKNGKKLAQWAVDKCEAYKGPTYDDQIWKLIVA